MFEVRGGTLVLHLSPKSNTLRSFMAGRGGSGSRENGGRWDFRWDSGSRSGPDGSWDYRWGAGSNGFGLGSGATRSDNGSGAGFGFGWGVNSNGGGGFSFGYGFGGGSGNGSFGFGSSMGGQFDPNQRSNDQDQGMRRART